MFKLNDYCVYASKGVCHIDDICEKSNGSELRTYYVFHPVTDQKHKIMVPTANTKLSMRPLIKKQVAAHVIDAFREPLKLEWADNKKMRDKEFDVIAKQGSLADRAELLKLLFQRRSHMKNISKRFCDTDNRLLNTMQSQLCHELAIVLDKSYEDIMALLLCAN